MHIGYLEKSQESINPKPMSKRGAASEFFILQRLL
jgi:hypothetical protein